MIHTSSSFCFVGGLVFGVLALILALKGDYSWGWIMASIILIVFNVAMLSRNIQDEIKATSPNYRKQKTKKSITK